MAKAKRKTSCRKKRAIKNPCPNNPAWSLARYQGFVRSAMRRAWLKWPPRFEVLKLARRPYVGPKKLQKHEFQCAKCHTWHVGKNVFVDHIVPWGSIWNLSLAEAWARLLVPATMLQVLCKTCHDLKTASEKILDLTVGDSP